MDQLGYLVLAAFDTQAYQLFAFTYKGKPLSSYCSEEWIEQVANVVESEIYHVDGENNSRAFSNVSLAYDNIKTEFYAKMKD